MAVIPTINKPKNPRCGFVVLWLGMVWGIVGCFVVIPATPTPQPTIAPTATPTATDWETLAPGLERRLVIPNDRLMAQMIVVRIDPALYTFRAHYRPDVPLLVSEWATTLPDAVAFINANFFDPENRVLGLLVADGVAHGTAYTTRGGLFAIQNGQPRIRSNITEPYQGQSEALEQAVQAFPMLVEDGAQAFFDSTGDRNTRRTAIGIDAQGRVMVLVTPLIGLTLAELSAFLATSDLGIVDAFNLDGGGSTMLWLRPIEYALVSRDPVPAVLAIYPRNS